MSNIPPGDRSLGKRKLSEPATRQKFRRVHKRIPTREDQEYLLFLECFAFGSPVFVEVALPDRRRFLENEHSGICCRYVGPAKSTLTGATFSHDKIAYLSTSVQNLLPVNESCRIQLATTVKFVQRTPTFLAPRTDLVFEHNGLNWSDWISQHFRRADITWTPFAAQIPEQTILQTIGETTHPYTLTIDGDFSHRICKVDILWAHTIAFMQLDRLLSNAVARIALLYM